MKVQQRGTARWIPMSGDTRGHAIKARRLAHGIKSIRAFAEETGVSRDAITAAEAGDASESTYERLEAWLSAFEEEIGADKPEDPQVVTFRLSGNFGVDVVVSGPIDNIEALEATVERLIRGMGQGPTK